MCNLAGERAMKYIGISCCVLFLSGCVSTPAQREERVQTHVGIVEDVMVTDTSCILRYHVGRMTHVELVGRGEESFPRCQLLRQADSIAVVSGSRGVWVNWSRV